MKQEHSFCCSSPKLSILSNPWEVEAEAEAEAQGIKTPPLIPPHSIAIPFKWEEIPGKPIQTQTQSNQALALTHSRSLHLPPRLQPLHSTPNSNSTSMRMRMRRSSSLSSSSAPSPSPDLCLIHQWPPSPSPSPTTSTKELLAQPCSLSFTAPTPTLGKKGILIKMRRSPALFAAILSRIRISLKKGR